LNISPMMLQVEGFPGFDLGWSFLVRFFGEEKRL
jgi:hypothetical protein